MRKAFVFNLFFNGLGVARALGKNGIDVIGLDCVKNPVGKFSKHVKQFYKVTSPDIDEKKFIEELIVIGKKYKEKPVLFPTNDIWSIAVSKNLSQIKQCFLTYNPDYETINKMIHKKIFYNVMEKNNILVPKTYNIDSYRKIENLKNDLIYPLVLKPNARMEINRTVEEVKNYNKNRIIEINSFSDFKKYINLIEKYDFILQQQILGNSNNMYTIGIYADKKSDIKGIFSGRKVRGYPVEYGDCYAGESYWNQNLVDISKNIIKLLKYTGIAEIEFKWNEFDNKFYLIEVNPRTWSWIGITPYTGVNLPLLAFNDLLGIDSNIIEMNKRRRVLWIRSIEDKYNCIFKNKNINNKDFPGNIKDYNRNLKDYDLVVKADFDNSDKLPGYFWLFVQLKNRIYGKIKDKLITKK